MRSIAKFRCFCKSEGKYKIALINSTHKHLSTLKLKLKELKSSSEFLSFTYIMTKVALLIFLFKKSREGKTS